MESSLSSPAGLLSRAVWCSSPQHSVVPKHYLCLRDEEVNSVSQKRKWHRRLQSAVPSSFVPSVRAMGRVPFWDYPMLFCTTCWLCLHCWGLFPCFIQLWLPKHPSCVPGCSIILCCPQFKPPHTLPLYIPFLTHLVFLSGVQFSLLFPCQACIDIGSLFFPSTSIPPNSKLPVQDAQLLNYLLFFISLI